MKDIRGGDLNQPSGYECYKNVAEEECVIGGSGVCMTMGNNGIPLHWRNCGETWYDAEGMIN